MLHRSIFMLAAGLVVFYPSLGLTQTSANLELQAQAVVATEYGSGVVGQAFVLDGTKSTDDGVVGTFAWKRVSGPYRFTQDRGVKISVIPSMAGTYMFELVVTDSTGKSSVVKKIQMLVAEKSDYVYQNNESGLDFVNKPATTASAGGTQDINIGIGEQEKKGNVEVSWKVEEGEKLTPVFLEIDTVKGESSDTREAGSGNDRLKSAGPVDGWPSGGVHIAAGDINGLTDEERQTFLTTVKTWAEVRSEQDMQNFALGVMMQKEQPAESLSLNYEKIRFTYNMPAKLFGFIPTSYRAEVAIDRGDNDNWDFDRVKVKFSWYAFLFRKDTSANELARMFLQDAKGGDKKEADPKSEGAVSWRLGAARAMQLISTKMMAKHDTVKNSIGNIR